jgi:hypothetical protein
MLEKGKPSEKVGRKVTDLSLRKWIRWQNCRATSEDPSSNPANTTKLKIACNNNQCLKKANHLKRWGAKLLT